MRTMKGSRSGAVKARYFCVRDGRSHATPTLAATTVRDAVQTTARTAAHRVRQTVPIPLRHHHKQVQHPASSPRRRDARTWRSRAAPPPYSTRPPPPWLWWSQRRLRRRAGVELKSAEVAKLDKGVRCLADEERDSDGKRRVRLINPIKGWASRKCLRQRRGPKKQKRRGVCAGSSTSRRGLLLIGIRLPARIDPGGARAPIGHAIQAGRRPEARPRQSLVDPALRVSVCLNLDQLASIKVARTRESPSSNTRPSLMIVSIST